MVRIARVADRTQPVPALRGEIARSAASPVDLGDRAPAVEAHGAPVAETDLVHLVGNAQRQPQRAQSDRQRLLEDPGGRVRRAPLAAAAARVVSVKPTTRSRIR